MRLQARIPCQAPAGAAYVLEIKSGGQPLGPLLNKSSQNFLKVFGPYQEADSLPPDYQDLKLAPRPIRFSYGPGPKGLAFDLAGDWRISPPRFQ